LAAYHHHHLFAKNTSTNNVHEEEITGMTRLKYSTNSRPGNKKTRRTNAKLTIPVRKTAMYS